LPFRYNLGAVKVVCVCPGSYREAMYNRSAQPEAHYASHLAGILTTVNEKKDWKSNTTFQYLKSIYHRVII